MSTFIAILTGKQVNFFEETAFFMFCIQFMTFYFLFEFNISIQTNLVQIFLRHIVVFRHC